MNPKDFSIKDIIKKRTNRESDIIWSQSENPPIPKVELPKKVKWSVGMYGLLREILP